MRSGTVAVLLLASPALLAAIPEKAAQAEEQPRYDPATVIEVMAKVTDVQEIPDGSPLSGIHLIVKAESEIMDVYLGPTEFLKQFEINFAMGNEIQVIGSKIKLGTGAKVVLAREVRKDEATLYCRRKKGEPNLAIVAVSPK